MNQPMPLNSSNDHANSSVAFSGWRSNLRLRILCNIGAGLAGLILGGLANGAIIAGGAAALPPPPGVDINDIVSINAHIGEYSVLQLSVPFAAHAMGTLIGAYIATLLALSQKLTIAMVIGVMFLVGGVMAVMMIPDCPLWFSALDLSVAYLPMGWLGWRMGCGPKRA